MCREVVVAENEQVNLMWDITILTDKFLGSSLPDLTLVHMSSYEWILIDIMVPWDKNIVKAEQVKTLKFQDLTEQIIKMYQAAAAHLDSFHDHWCTQDYFQEFPWYT